MSVNSAELDNQERDLHLRTRGVRASGKPKNNSEAPAPDAVQELETLKARIEAARKITPKGRDLHCRECWNRGRDAAIRVIEGQAEEDA